MENEKGERHLAMFIIKNQRKINNIQMQFFDLFNQVGKETKEGKLQAGFLTTMIIILCKGSGIKKDQLLKVLYNATQKV